MLNRLRKYAALALLAGALIPATAVLGRPADPQDKGAREEGALQDRFKKWMEEEVPYIISEDEKAVFKSLTTTAEKERFIEQFWRRRDPDPRTPENEYREEYYRRIAYANDHFSAGIPGWKTDRGRTYIMFGPPDEIISHPSGGTYFRSTREGGGETVAWPFDVWRYRYIEGVGPDVEVEFVDKNFSGNYVIALDPEEKDALLNVPAIGLTRREEMGLTNKRDRSTLPVDGSLTQDSFFERLMRYTDMQKAPVIKYNDLRSRVETREFYQVFPVRMNVYQLWVSPTRAAVPISVEIENRNLRFEEKYGTQRARVEIYGLVRALEGRIVAEFEDQLAVDYPADQFERHLSEKSVYQKILLIPPGRYKVSLALKDTASGGVSTLEQGLVLSPFQQKQLAISSLILARRVEPIGSGEDAADPFALGDYKVIPNVAAVYGQQDRLGVYFQLYNVVLDKRSMNPGLTIRYEIMKEGKPVVEYMDLKGESVQRVAPDRLVLIHGLPLEGLATGRYVLNVTVQDEISHQTVTSATPFDLR